MHARAKGSLAVFCVSNCNDVCTHHSIAAVNNKKLGKQLNVDAYVMNTECDMICYMLRIYTHSTIVISPTVLPAIPNSVLLLDAWMLASRPSEKVEYRHWLEDIAQVRHVLLRGAHLVRQTQHLP